MSLDILNPETYQYQINGNFVQISPLALNILDEFIKDIQSKLDRPFKLLEFGSGASTVYWLSKYPNIELYSVEGDKEWFEQVKTWVKPKVYEFHEASNFYRSVSDFNPDYFLCAEKYGPFDLIINDGAMREIVGNYILERADDFITPGGMYLRHDYEKAIDGSWVGFNQFGKVEPIMYEKFVSLNPNYRLITVNGNGKWGYKCELGGIWRIQ